MIGRTLSHFRILAKIGEGEMGVVYRAEDTDLRRPVDIKWPGPVCGPSPSGSPLRTRVRVPPPPPTHSKSII